MFVSSSWHPFPRTASSEFGSAPLLGWAGIMQCSDSIWVRVAFDCSYFLRGCFLTWLGMGIGKQLHQQLWLYTGWKMSGFSCTLFNKVFLKQFQADVPRESQLNWNKLCVSAMCFSYYSHRGHTVDPSLVPVVTQAMFACSDHLVFLLSLCCMHYRNNLKAIVKQDISFIFTLPDRWCRICCKQAKAN